MPGIMPPEMKALILTGGQGTRLRPFTLSVLKPLLPLVNVPFLSYPLALLRRHGVRDVILGAGGDAGPYRDFIESERRKGTRMACSGEPAPLGTGGAVRNASRRIGLSSFIVLNGDTLCDADFTRMRRFHERKKSAVTVALVPVGDPSHYGLVRMDPDGRILEFSEKREAEGTGKKRFLINAGIYIFENRMLDFIPRGRFFSVEKDLFPFLLGKKMPLYGFVLPGSRYWIDIGTPKKYLEANLDLLDPRLCRRFLGEGPGPEGAGTRVHPSARVIRSVLGKDCRVGPGAVLEDCVLLDRAVVEEGARLRGVVAGRRARVGAFCMLKGGVFLGEDSRISPFTRSIPFP